MSAYVRNYIRACEAYGWDGGPEFKTDLRPMENKAEKRNAQWSQSRFFANLPFNNITQAAAGSVLDMFDDRMGRWGAFLYRDRLRYSVDDHVFGVGDGASQEFQLVYVSHVGTRERLRNIYALYVPDPSDPEEALPSDVVVRVNGSPVVAVSIDHDRGRVTFDAAPANGAVLSWSGQFSHWVRFNQDQLPFSIDNRTGGAAGQYVVNGDVEIIGVNPPRPSELEASS